MKFKILVVSVIIGLMMGCSPKSKRRYHKRFDGAPKKHEIPVNIDHIPDALPKPEPKSKYGNLPKYKVFNRTYRVMDSSHGFKEQGHASWYGNKFHGYRTSSGEKYDMYSMTAAHKTLPLPTYLLVKNLSNGRQVIVKVNDRGPFHGNRILDLSYAAAHKIGMLGTGTAKVEIVALDPKKFKHNYIKDNVAQVKKESNNALIVAEDISQNNQKKNKLHYLQLGVFTDRAKAEKLRAAIKRIPHNRKVIVVSNNNNSIFKVKLGPILNLEDSKKIKDKIIAAKLPVPVSVYD